MTNKELLNRISDTLDSIKIVQVEQAKDISYHIKRTDLLEESVDVLKKVVLENRAFKYRLQGGLALISFLSIASVTTWLVRLIS